MTEETKRLKAKNLRFKKPICRDLNLDAVKSNLYDIMCECEDIRWYTDSEDGEDTLINALAGDEDEAYEFKMAFADLCAECERMQSDLEEEWIPECFDIFFVAAGAGDYLGYDETEDQEEPEGPADIWTAKVISLAEDPEGNQEECTEFIQNRSMKRVYKAALRLCRSQNTAFAAFYKNLSMKEIDTDDARNEETKAEYQLFKGSLGAILLSAKNHRKKLYTIRTNGKNKKGG